MRWKIITGLIKKYNSQDVFEVKLTRYSRSHELKGHRFPWDIPILNCVLMNAYSTSSLWSQSCVRVICDFLFLCLRWCFVFDHNSHVINGQLALSLCGPLWLAWGMRWGEVWVKGQTKGITFFFCYNCHTSWRLFYSYREQVHHVMPEQVFCFCASKNSSAFWEMRFSAFCQRDR